MTRSAELKNRLGGEMVKHHKNCIRSNFVRNFQKALKVRRFLMSMKWLGRESTRDM